LHTATLLPSGKVLVVGGDGYGILASAELYDPKANSWTSAGSLSTARMQHTATLLPNGKVLVVGGYYGIHAGNYGASAELYDPGANRWTSAGSPTRIPRARAARSGVGSARPGPGAR
jgi:hypothetical protein